MDAGFGVSFRCRYRSEGSHLSEAETALRLSLQCPDPTADSISDRVRRLLALGSVLKLDEDFLGARVAYDQVTAIVRANPGVDDHIVAEYHYRRGLLLHDLGELECSRCSLERAFEMQRALYDVRSSAVVAATRLALGDVLLDAGDMRSARIHIVRALCQFVVISAKAIGTKQAAIEC
jgi:tetratricopeptide (TPR) repeat protein